MPDLTEKEEFKIDPVELDRILAERGRRCSDVIGVLQGVQEKYNYLPESALRYICRHSDITPAAITGISTFYHQFRHSPAGKHRISVCIGTACHIKGASRITEALRRFLSIADGDDTDTDKLFTLQEVGCLGCCSLAPAVQIDDVIYGPVATDGVSDMLNNFLQQQNSDASEQKRDFDLSDEQVLGEVRIGLGSCCIASGAAKVEETLNKTLRETQLPVRIRRVGCVGMCHSEPLLEIFRPDRPPRLYANIKPEDVPAILNQNFSPPRLRQRLKYSLMHWLEHLYTDEAWNNIRRYPLDTREPRVASFLNPQTNIATEDYGQLDPLSIRAYKETHGFEAFRRILCEMTSSEVLEWITSSGLRGRGGGGFPTGAKWREVAMAENQEKYIICNSDEGDPGAFMDRMLLESYPFRVIEGMAIAAYATGAGEGVFYIRSEYPLAVQRVRQALEICRHEGLLGLDIMGRGFSFDLRIAVGAGAFVCGEETALIASLEGKRGMPRIRPPYPSESGLYGCPTLINNTETFSLVPWIMRHGAKAFAAIGTEHSKGTKVFALAGKIERGGLIEVPMGMTIRQVVNEIGGGVPGRRRFKAVQIGGPSGGCIPERMADIPIDYEALVEAGAMMGSGGLVVLDDTDCMVEIARYFLEFAQYESCGKCTFCRIGTRRMLEILERLCAGQGKSTDVGELETLTNFVKQGSLCGLGRTAPNPVLTTLAYFRDEYEAHLNGRCPAGQCKGLISYFITDDCIGCTRCAQDCPAEAIISIPYEKHLIEDAKCVRCDGCRQACPNEAVMVKK